MKKISNFIVKARYWLLGVFVILVGVSCFLMTEVNINYNLMQYLDSDSTSTVALTKMEDEFGSVGQCQVVVKNVKYDDAIKIKGVIENIDGVSSVVFARNENDSEYYNNNSNDALYKVFLTTGDFDTASYKTLDRIRDSLSGYDIALSGGSVDSQFLTTALGRDMIIILIVVVAVVFIILAITSTSWFEPVLFLVVAGGAILINMGSNILLNWIPYIGNSMSFITKSIAAVMQLALSMDYAIVLLHAYREEKENNVTNNEAMAKALAKSFAPVSSSSITTIAGLVALMFMSFSIGFDVGLVLAKGILISLLSVFLFMPGLLLLCDKLLVKTSHKPLDIIIKEHMDKHNEKKLKAGKKVYTITDFQVRTKIIIPALALFVVIAGAIYNYKTEYSFTLKASTDENSVINLDNEYITNEFGTQNTLVVLLPKNGKNRNELAETENSVVNYLTNYEYKNNKVISSAQGYSTYGVYNNLTAEEFANTYLDKNSYNANLRGINVLYSYLEKEGIAKRDANGDLRANVYDVIEYAAKNEGAVKITNESQALINQLNSVYNTKLTKEQFAAANNLSLDVVSKVYEAAGLDEMTTYEVLKFIVDNNYAVNAFNSVQNEIDYNYNQLVEKHVFNEDGSVNTTTIKAMNTFCAAYEKGILDTDDETIKAEYTKYKTVLKEFTYDELLATYPFITENVAKSLLNGSETISNYLVIQASSLKQIAKTYGATLNTIINSKYNQIPAKNEVITKEYAVMNYGIDNETLEKLFKNEVTNQSLIALLASTNYYKNQSYINEMNNQFVSNYEAFNNFESNNYIRVIFNLDMAKSGDDSFAAIKEITNHLYNEYEGVEVVSETFVYSQIKDVFNNDIIIVNIISFVAILLIIALTFRSYFVPLLLTLLIQGAIWLTMGISTIFGNEVFFICYIVVMCVQMGATIDYGILLTNNYIINRSTYDKNIAMKNALTSSITTILVSGSILVLATLIIGLVSNVSIVSDLGLLLSRGCLISVLMIIFVLPQCLLLCDKLIEKTSRHTKFYHPEDEYVKVEARIAQSK